MSHPLETFVSGKLAQVATRRRLFTAAGTAGAGLTALALVGCGDGQTSQSTAPRIDTIPPIARTEAPASKEGILPLGNYWQLEVQSWEEQPSMIGVYARDKYEREGSRVEAEKDGQLRVYREGWKYVTIAGRKRNLGTKLSSPPDLETLYFLSDDGNKYPIHYITSVTAPLPPGFSNKFSVSEWIPQIKNAYFLVVGPPRSNNEYVPPGTPQPALSKIPKGEVAKESPLISPNAQINDISKPWVIPNLREITYGRSFSIQNIFRYLSLNLRNSTGQDISPNNLSFVVFLKDGNTLAGEVETFYPPTTVPPGFSKPFNVALSGVSRDYLRDGFEEKIKGGVLVGISKDTWFAWQLS